MEHEDAIATICRFRDIVKGLEEKIHDKESTILFVK